MLCAALGSTISEGCEGTQMHPEEDNKAGERAGMSYEKQQKILGLSSLGNRRLRGDFIALQQLPEEGKWRGRC